MQCTDPNPSAKTTPIKAPQSQEDIIQARLNRLVGFMNPASAGISMLNKQSVWSKYCV
jgi:hypothetical protein